MCVCVCVRACVRARARARVYVCVCLMRIGIMYLVFTRMPGEGTVGDSDFCCCVRMTSFVR